MRKTKKKKSKAWILLMLLFVIAFAYKSDLELHSQSLFRKILRENPESIPLLTTVSDAPFPLPLEYLNSNNAFLVELDNHQVLMQKNSTQKIYPASLTKIMTAIVAIEKLADSKEKIPLSNSMFQELNKADASMAGFQPDEKVQAIDLLYGVMLPSGGECCLGLANRIAGSEKKFVELMNQKAALLGMNNTHFSNSTGLQDRNHFTTVKDLSVLLSYALQNHTFRKIFTASQYSTAPTNKHPSGITFQNTMFKNMKNPVIEGGKILGGKTGYTAEAGLCLASLAQKNGREFILITAGAKGNHESEQYHIDDAYAVYNHMKKQK